MKRNNRLPELLAPAGSYDAMLAAVAGGADAIYLGGTGFNARASAQNFTDDRLDRAVQYCHAHGVKVYVTLNTLLYDKELEAFLSYARTLADMHADAVIVADVGAISLLRQHVPALPIHASTQASAHSSDGVRALAAMGAERVVVARELSQQDLTALIDASPVEIEVFVHGALCVCHSGQCLFSSMIGGRSGNRGECAQPCRLPYNGKYPLSLRDLSLAAHIPTLIDMGIASLKIEGRMKAPSYVYQVTRMFRRLLDERRGANSREMRQLALVFSRDGLTDGYFTGTHAAPMTGTRSEADKAASRTYEGSYTPVEQLVPLTGTFTAHKGNPITLSLLRLDGRGDSVTVTGDMPVLARSTATDEAAVADKLTRMGDTPFTLDVKHLTCHMDAGLFLPVSTLNRLRREACALLLHGNQHDRPAPPLLSSLPPAPHRVMTARTWAQFEAACMFYDKKEGAAAPAPSALPHAHGIGRAVGGFDITFLDFAAYTERLPMLTAGDRKPDGVILPPVITDGEKEEVLSLLVRLQQIGVAYALTDNIGALSLAKAAKLIPYGGMRLNITNRAAASAYMAEGLAGLLLSPELSLPQLRDMGGGAPLLYGYLPLMLTERCFIKDMTDCSHCDHLSLTDRKGVRFPILRTWKHRNVIMNSRPHYLFDKHKELRAARVFGGAVCFTTEDEARTQQILRMREEKTPPDTDVRRLYS